MLLLTKPKTTITVEVTKEMIDKAQKLRIEHRSTHCPVALAFKALGYTNVSVGSYVYAEELKPKFLPIAARDFIRDFDLVKEVKPFSFEIKLDEAK
jgi:hypothetical protein